MGGEPHDPLRNWTCAPWTHNPDIINLSLDISAG
jgi:hypothetical protein